MTTAEQIRQNESAWTAEGHAVAMAPLCRIVASGGRFGRGMTKRFVADEIACPDCRALVISKGPASRDLLAEIKAGMLKQNPSIALEEWEVE